MKGCIEIGATPCNEDCQQLGKEDYDVEKAKKECRAFINQIRRVLGKEPENAYLSVKGQPHDFGTYYEVVCYYSKSDDEGMRYAFRCESEAPTDWDEEAKKELLE